MAFDQKEHISLLILEYLGQTKEIHVSTLVMIVEACNGYQYCSDTKWYYSLFQKHVKTPFLEHLIKGWKIQKVRHFILNFNESCIISYIYYKQPERQTSRTRENWDNFANLEKKENIEISGDSTLHINFVKIHKLCYRCC